MSRPTSRPIVWNHLSEAWGWALPSTNARHRITAQTILEAIRWR